MRRARSRFGQIRSERRRCYAECGITSACALVARPDTLLADEPTGNLDSATGQEIMGLLRKLNEQDQLTIAIVTHHAAIGRQAHHSVRLVEGRLTDEKSAKLAGRELSCT